MESQPQSKFRPHEHYFENGEFYFPTGFGRSFTINMKDLNNNLLLPNENINDFSLKLANKDSCELTFSGKNELAAIIYNKDSKCLELKVNKSVFVMKHTCSSHSGPNDEFEPYNKTIELLFEDGIKVINQYMDAVNNLL